jgi:hypothetical protein
LEEGKKIQKSQKRKWLKEVFDKALLFRVDSRSPEDKKEKIEADMGT